MKTNLWRMLSVLSVVMAVSLMAVPGAATTIDFVDASQDAYGDRLVPSSDGQADGGQDDTYGSNPAVGIVDFDTPNIDVEWGYDLNTGNGNSDHWIAVFKPTSDTECFFTPNGFGDTNRAPEPVTLTADSGWLVQLQTIAIRSGGNQGSSSQSKVFVDGGLVFDTGELTGSGGYLHDHVVDLSGVAPAALHQLDLEFYLNGQLACNNSAIRLLEFAQVPEPSTLMLLACGLVTLLGCAVRWNR